MPEFEEAPFVPDMDAIAEASAALVDAEAVVRDAESKVSAAEDTLADADDDVMVAEMKVEDYTADEKKLPWQIASAQRELAKKTRAHARATQRCAAARQALQEAQTELAAAREALDVARRTPASSFGLGDGMQLMVSRVPLTEAPAALVQWVEGTLQDRMTGLGKTETRWCDRWTEHPDAVQRLAAMFDEWQFMLLGGKGAPSLHMIIREVLDYHMPYLVSKESGIFAKCGEDGHEPHRRLDADLTAAH
jgi:hypothetical protein